MRNYTVSPEFKTQVTAILQTKKFSAVFPFMNLVNREGFEYTEQELNQLVQFLGEFPYNEVAEFFQILPSMVTEQGQPESAPQNEFANETVETAG
jgi:hypothetical protein